ncbi:ARMC10 (predicted) [Pycnogonum litorale]
MSNSSSGSLQKTAICSVIAAGFAYVGFSIFKSTFCRCSKANSVDEEVEAISSHLLLNSRGSQTDISQLKTVGVGPDNENGDNIKTIVFPKQSVQDRVRELNIQDQLFPSSGTLLYGQKPVGNALLKSRSAQSTPWSSPRIVSPTIPCSMSVDNLKNNPHPLSPKLRRNSTSRRRYLSGGDTKSNVSGVFYSSFGSNTMVIPLETEESLLKKLDGLFMRGRVINRNEAKSLVILLYSKSEEVLVKTINTVSNCSAFSVNQDLFREVCCLPRLMTLAAHPILTVKLSSVQALGNLSLNEENQTEIQGSLPLLKDIFENTENPELLRQSSVSTLTNMAVMPNYHKEYYTTTDLIGCLLNELDVGTDKLQLHCLKLLVNLSCNEVMVPYLLASKAPKSLLKLLNPAAIDDDRLLRLVTFLSNVIICKVKYKLEVCHLPTERKAASPEMVFTMLFGHATHEKLLSKCLNLSQNGNIEIKEHSLKILNALNAL